MARISPKIEIINHFDNLINRIDIDIDSSLENFNDEILHDKALSSLRDRFSFHYENLNSSLKVIKYDDFDSSKNQTAEIWPESTKVIDYLKQIRMRTIEELKKEQEKTLEKYKLNSAHFKSGLNFSKDELRRELFDEKFHFQIQIKRSIWAFNLFTLITDFYLSQSDIESLE